MKRRSLPMRSMMALEMRDAIGFGFVAEPRSDVGHCPDGGIVVSSLEANGA
jgi:hypothetical protein